VARVVHGDEIIFEWRLVVRVVRTKKVSTFEPPFARNRCLVPAHAGYFTNAEATAMRFASEELVRVVVSAILRSAPWTHAFLCYLCLLNLMLEHLGPAYNEYEVRRTMDLEGRRPELN